MALESVGTQRSGLVFIYDMSDSKYANFDYDLSQKILTLLKVIKIHFLSMKPYSPPFQLIKQPNIRRRAIRYIVTPVSFPSSLSSSALGSGTFCLLTVEAVGCRHGDPRLD